MKKIQPIRRLTALLLAASLLLSLAACGGEKAAATTMRLIQTEGTVDVADGEGKGISLKENLGLYSGYQVDTQSESYAWINLDSVKLTKMDQDSEITIQKEDKHLEIEVKSGSLFFNVTQPLAEDESMNIRTSTMAVGIRGTCGWVEVPDGEHMTLYLLEGQVECTAGESTAAVTAGQAAVMAGTGEITVAEFTSSQIPGFVLEEVKEDSGLVGAILEDSGLDVLAPPDPTEAALAAYRTIVGQAASYFPDDTNYGGMEVTKTYLYALVPMQAEYQVPALILEEETYGDFWGDLYTAIVFQYDPDSQTVIQAEGVMEEGVAAVGGYRGSLTAAGDGNGILETSWSSGTGEGSTDRLTIEGASLRRVTIWSGIINGDTTGGVGEAGINWYQASDLSGLSGLTAPQPSAPSKSPRSPREPQGSLLSPYVGDYTPYEEANGYGGGEQWRGVSLSENGVITGGGTSWYSLDSSGVEPASITQEADGSIVISFSENEYYTVYPAGVIPEGYDTARLDLTTVNLRYFLFDGGVMDIMYHK